jgi:DNA-binding IclR family transcriptional regulator
VSRSGFPDDLVRFIVRRLPTYRAVEILVHLARDPARTWTAGEIAAALAGLPEGGVREGLEHLVREGLVAVEGEGRFRYAPSADELRDAVTLLVDAYDRRPVTLVRLMDSLATERIRSFADSFRLKRDKRDRRD